MRRKDVLNPNLNLLRLIQVNGEVFKNQIAIEERVKQGSCYVIATTVPKKELKDQEVVEAYKGQNSSVERGFRFLKDPLFFTSSLFIKKPERIMGLLMVMTLALLVYSIAQRNVRLYLEKNRETLPNQIKKETTKPTLRWIFQLMEGIELVQVQINETVKFTISGLTTLRMRILTCFSTSVKKNIWNGYMNCSALIVNDLRSMSALEKSPIKS